MREQLTERARDLRQTSTPTEQKLWYWLRRRYLHGYKFRRQHPIHRYVLDFYCAQLRLCIELDGDVHEERVLRDAERTRYLATRGIYVLRLANDYIDEQPGGAWDLIVATVQHRVREIRPSP